MIDVPAAPGPDIRGLQFRELNNALAYLSHAQFHYERGQDEDGRMWLDDARRSLGGVALLLADGPDAEGYARLLEAVLTRPSVRKCTCADLLREGDTAQPCALHGWAGR